MGAIISCSLKFVVQILNTTLFLAFLAVGIFGILLKTSKSVVQDILHKIFNQFNIGDEDMRELAQFIVQNGDGIAVILMAVGFALAILCLIGCIALCCGFGLLLKIYAIILFLLTVAQIIVVAVLFSDPNRISGLLVKAMTDILPNYALNTEEGKTATAVWNVLMTFNSTCCGMDSYADFKDQSALPLQCCNTTATGTCNAATAETAKVPGCRDKIVSFIADNLKLLMYIAIGAILLQAALVIIVFLTICL